MSKQDSSKWLQDQRQVLAEEIVARQYDLQAERWQPLGEEGRHFHADVADGRASLNSVGIFFWNTELRGEITEIGAIYASRKSPHFDCRR